jgi:hypothetical protein
LSPVRAVRERIVEMFDNYLVSVVITYTQVYRAA